MSDVDIMAALVGEHAGTYFSDWTRVSGTYRCSTSNAKKAAQALYDAGFRLSGGSTDSEQNERLRAIESRLDRIEGYMVIR